MRIHFALRVSYEGGITNGFEYLKVLHILKLIYFIEGNGRKHSNFIGIKAVHSSPHRLSCKNDQG